MVKQHPVTKRFMKDEDYEKLMRESAPKSRGGRRRDAGRKPVEGTKRKLTITLPDETWSKIQSMVDEGECASLADYFRQRELESV